MHRKDIFHESSSNVNILDQCFVNCFVVESPHDEYEVLEQLFSAEVVRKATKQSYYTLYFTSSMFICMYVCMYNYVFTNVLTVDCIIYANVCVENGIKRSY